MSDLILPRWLTESLPSIVGGEVPTSNEEKLASLRRASSTLDEPMVNPDMSAVLILLSGDAEAASRPDDAKVVLTHRATTLRRHAGQMSFPGGRCDPGDRDAVHTALREANEETGLNPHSVTPLQVLDPIDISRTGFAVHPVLAYWNQPHDLAVMDTAETESVLNVPITDLVNPENRMQVGFEDWTGPAFKVGDFVVWGFTAGVLTYLLDAAGWAEPWDNRVTLDLREQLANSANGETLGSDGKLR